MSKYLRPLAEIREGILQALDAVRSNKFRSFFKMLVPLFNPFVVD